MNDPPRIRKSVQIARSHPFDAVAGCLELAARSPEPKLRDRLLRMVASFQIDADLLAISQSRIDKSRELLASLRDGQSTGALLKNSRAMIDESRSLLAALERPAPARRNDDAHHQATGTPAAAPIEPTADGVRADADRNPARLSVGVFKKESCFGWALYSITNELLGRGNAKTEHKARIDALSAGMTYIDRLKGRSPPDTDLH
jgi:hypothetical protein